MRRLKGLIPVLLTPMDVQKQPCPLGTRSLVDFLIDKNVGGFWALGSASEDTSLGAKQKTDAIRYVAEANRARIPLICGVSYSSMEDVKKQIDSVADLAIDAYHVLALDVKMSERVTVRYFEAIADYANKPVWIYHNPKRARPITADMVSELAQHPNIAGVKVGGYDLTLITRCLRLNSEDFQVIVAGGGQIYPALCLGAEAHTTSEGSCVPELFLNLLEYFDKGEYDKALAQQWKIFDFSSRMPRTGNGEYAAEEKAILKLRGVCDPYVNSSYDMLGDNEMKILHQLLKDYNIE